MKNWLQAARLRTLPLSLSGIVLGTFLAASVGFVNWKITVLAIFTTIGFQVISNFANDYGDGVKGTDNENRIGPQRALQSGAISPKQMLFAIRLVSVITFILALALIYVSFGSDNILYILLFLFLGIASIVAAVKYTMGKNPYGYSGFGDIFVFLFFGLLAVLGTYFLYTQQLNWVLLLPASTIGLLSAGVLNLNNMRDINSDKQSNKDTLVVKMGLRKAKRYHVVITVLAMLFAVLYSLLHYQNPQQFVYLLAFLPIFKHLSFVKYNDEPVKFDPELKKLALSTFLFALLFGLGMLL
jgi:1,4-dihydroxy-2-naphthoate octaprenyltransferase